MIPVTPTWNERASYKSLTSALAVRALDGKTPQGLRSPSRWLSVKSHSAPIFAHVNSRWIQCVTLGVSREVYTEVHVGSTPVQ